MEKIIASCSICRGRYRVHGVTTMCSGEQRSPRAHRGVMIEAALNRLLRAGIKLQQSCAAARWLGGSSTCELLSCTSSLSVSIELQPGKCSFIPCCIGVLCHGRGCCRTHPAQAQAVPVDICLTCSDAVDSSLTGDAVEISELIPQMDKCFLAGKMKCKGSN